MRIALIHNRLIHRGGLETRLFSYIDEFRSRGHSVSLVVSKISPDITLPDDVEIIKVNLSYIPKLFRDYWLSRSIGRLHLTESFDFTLSLARTPYQSAVLAPGNHLGFLKAIDRNHRGLKDRLDIHIERKSFETCRLILAASTMMKEELVTLYGLPESKIRVLFPPTDVRRFNREVKNRRDDYRQRFNCSPEKKTCAFVSVSHGRKGLPLLLEVFAQLRNEPYELLVAGEARMGAMPENVKYLGYLKETEQLYAAADAMLLPAIYEPFGQVVSESLLCGTPVALSHMVGARQIITPSEGLVISGFEVDTWVKAVRDICSRPFYPNPDLAALHRLSVQDHVSAMLGYWEEVKNV
ncbi:MAG: glycosyltransferase family 4 protein [Candidatus Zixiibacteriota bacterium]